MYLVDTSVWIDYINNTETKSVLFLDQLLGNPKSVGLNAQIYMEILQGSLNQKSFDTFKHYFAYQNFYHFNNEIKSHEEAAQIYFICRKKGITIRSALDCLIAQCAIENEIILLHNDNDFKQMVKVIPELKHQCFI